MTLPPVLTLPCGLTARAVACEMGATLYEGPNLRLWAAPCQGEGVHLVIDTPSLVPNGLRRELEDVFGCRYMGVGPGGSVLLAVVEEWGVRDDAPARLEVAA